MQWPVVAGVAVVAVLVLVRHYAARRVAARQGRFVWLMFLPTFLGGFGILGAGVSILPTVPAAGVVLVVAGSIYIAILLGFMTRLSAAVTSTRPGDDLANAMSQPLEDFRRTWTGFVLIGGVAAVVGLLVWGASQASR